MRRARNREPGAGLRVFAALAVFTSAGCIGGAAEPSILREVECVRDSAGPPTELWNSAIEAYEAADEVSPPERGSIVFIGSSSILFWGTLGEDMAPMPTVNRGFGGSVISHATHFADRIVLPYEPSAVVLYAGDNDIAFGSSSDCTLRDFEAFVARIRATVPRTPIYYISIKPSPSRREMWPEMERANHLIAARTTTEANLVFVDVSEAMLDEEGEPRADLFLDDGLHMTPAGYALWTSIVGPRLRNDLAF